MFKKKHKILIVDDDPTCVKVVDSYVSAQGYETITAKDGEDALAKISSDGPFDLILLDVQMPNMNGYSFLFEIKKIEGMEKVPIVVLTSKDEMEELFKVEGVRDYLVKPVNADQLIAALQKNLA